jgi:hypothetical protein
MSGETENNISDWTVDTLHDHFQRLLEERRVHYSAQIEALDKRYTQRFEAVDQMFHSGEKRFEERFQAQKEAVSNALIAADRAVGKAEVASEKRFDSVNEFRAALADQTARLMPRTESEARLASISEKLDSLVDRVNRSEGKNTGIATSWAIAVAVIGMALGIGGIILAITR